MVADTIASYARALENSKGSKIEALYSLLLGCAEASEFKVFEDFKYLNICLKDLKIKDNVLVAGIIRNKQVIIPSGEDYISVGDKVIIVTAGDSISDLAEIV